MLVTQRQAIIEALKALLAEWRANNADAFTIRAMEKVIEELSK